MIFISVGPKLGHERTIQSSQGKAVMMKCPDKSGFDTAPPLSGLHVLFINIIFINAFPKPLKKNATPEETEEYNKAAEKMKPKVNFIVC